MTHASLKLRLLHQVQRVWQQGRTIQHVWRLADCAQPPLPVGLGWQTLRLAAVGAAAEPLRDGSEVRIRYRSALGQRLGKQSPQAPTAAALAAAMMADWPLALAAAALPWQGGDEAGWLWFDLAIADLAPWFADLAQPLPAAPDSAPPLPLPKATQLFQLQATHARCCSLLAQVSDQPDLQTVPWDALEPPAYGWLQGAIAATDAWQAHQLGLDKLPLSQPLLQLATGFEQIHQRTPLWGELTPARRQVYLGLVLITQRLLSQLLRLGWGISAWTTL